MSQIDVLAQSDGEGAMKEAPMTPNPSAGLMRQDLAEMRQFIGVVMAGMCRGSL